MKTFLEWLLVESYSETFYHGTQIGLLHSILRQGLKKDAQKSWTTLQAINYATKAIYLTSHKQLAARYGVQAERKAIPVIIEIKISMPKRFNKMQYDPMDRSAEAWNEDGDLHTIEDDAVNDIKFHLNKLARLFPVKNISKFVDFDIVSSNEIGLGYLNGFKIYNYILEKFQRDMNPETFKMLRHQLLQAIQKEFSPGVFSEYLEITPSGTFRVLGNYYHNKEQWQYFKNIPPQMFKALWVRKKDFPDIRGQEEEFGIQSLPGEAKDLYDELKDFYQRAYNVKDEDDLEDIADESEDYKDHEDFAQEIRNMIDEIKNGEDIDDVLERFRDLISYYEDDLYSNYGTEDVENVESWVRVDTRDTVEVGKILARG